MPRPVLIKNLGVLVVSATALAITAGQAGSQSRDPAGNQRSWSATHDSVAAAALRFFFVWGEAWRVSEATRHPIQLLVYSPRPDSAYFRAMQAACYLRTPHFRYAYQRRGIPDGETGWGVCPSWFAGSFEMPPDEQSGIDGALIERVAGPVRAARERLLALIDTTVVRNPADAWLVGQFVRFAVDQRAFSTALDRLRGCAVVRWWCAALEAYVRTAQHDFTGAGRAVDAAFTAMPPEIRCGWTDHVRLFDSTDAARYARLPCGAQRDSANRALWWLSDPLLSVPGNERRVEQFVRNVSLALRTALDRDERFEWRQDEGGAARAELVARYGWPSYVYWSGFGRDIWLADRQVYVDAPHTHPINDVSPTYEYARSRLHLVPDSTAFSAPHEARSSAWTLADPATIPGRLEFGRPPPGVVTQVEWPAREAATLISMHWWPREHAATPLVITQIADGQVALLRRERDVMIATSNLAPTFVSATKAASATLVVSPMPDSVEILERRPAGAQSAVTLQGMTRAARAVVGVEVVDSAHAGRTRFGVVAPHPLIALQAGEVAVSDPVILANESAQLAGSVMPDSVLRLMAPSLTIPRSTKTLGVYWEMYGFQPSDSVDIAVWIERRTPQSLARRLGIAFSVAEDLNTPVVVSWRALAADADAHVVSGAVPIIARRLQLSVAALPDGEYSIEIAAARRGEAPVRGRRTIVRK